MKRKGIAYYLIGIITVIFILYFFRYFLVFIGLVLLGLFLWLYIQSKKQKEVIKDYFGEEKTSSNDQQTFTDIIDVEYKESEIE